MRRGAFALRSVLLSLALVSASCVSLDAFFFSPTPEDQYTFPYASDWPASERVPPELRTELTLHAADGSDVAAVWVQRPDAEAATAPTVVYNHGNADNIDYYWNRVSLLWSLGANVLVYDYPGYGRTPGHPTEAGIYAAARAAFAYVRTLGSIDQTRVYIYGWSLGGASATELAYENASAGLILESTFTSVSALAADGSLLVPSSFVMTNQFDNLSKIRQAAHNARQGVLLFHGDADDFVQLRYGRDLDAKIGEMPQANAHTLIVVHGATHGDVPFVSDQQADPSQRYSDLVREFLTRAQ